MKVASQPVASALAAAGRWVVALTWRGLLGGVAHTVLALTFGGVLGEQTIGLIPLAIVFGAPIGALLAAAAGILTAPAAVWAHVTGSWGRLRPVVVAGPALVLVVVAGLAFQFEPHAEPMNPARVVTGLALFHVGPACWAAAILYRLTARWPA